MFGRNKIKLLIDCIVLTYKSLHKLSRKYFWLYKVAHLNTFVLCVVITYTIYRFIRSFDRTMPYHSCMTKTALLLSWFLCGHDLLHEVWPEWLQLSFGSLFPPHTGCCRLFSEVVLILASSFSYCHVSKGVNVT